VARFEKMGDLFEPVLELKQQLPNLRKAGAAVEPQKVEIAAQADASPPRKLPKSKRR
jgi:hypothetical protein